MTSPGPSDLWPGQRRWAILYSDTDRKAPMLFNGDAAEAQAVLVKERQQWTCRLFVEAAEAQPVAPDAWLFICRKPGLSTTYASVDEYDTNHYPLDQWRSVVKKPLYARAPPVGVHQKTVAYLHTLSGPGEWAEELSFKETPPKYGSASATWTTTPLCVSPQEPNG